MVLSFKCSIDLFTSSIPKHFWRYPNIISPNVCYSHIKKKRKRQGLIELIKNYTYYDNYNIKVLYMITILLLERSVLKKVYLYLIC